MENTETRTPQEEVEKVRAYFRSIGMASYSINGLPEDESILSFIREKNSFRYCLVRDPYSRSKNLIFRLFKVDIWRPSIPMGYSCSVGMLFDYMGEDALQKAKEIAEIVFRGKYKGRIMKDESCFERISFKLVNPDQALDTPLAEEQKEFLKKHNYQMIKT